MQTSTRVETTEGELVVPKEVHDAMVQVESASPLVSAEGFSKLSHATFNNPMMKESAGAAGAIQTIVQALERNQGNGSVQEDGCHALRNICFHCPANLDLAREQGAIGCVMKALEMHLDNEAVQMEGCWALLVFCTNHETNTAAASSALPLIRQAVDKYPENKDIQSKGKFLQVLLA